MREGLLPITEFSQNCAEIAMRKRQTRIEPNGATIALGGRNIVVTLCLHSAEVDIGFRGVRIDDERLGEQSNSLGKVSALCIDDRQHMQRVELRGIFAKNLFERGFCFTQVASLKGGKRAMQSFCDFTRWSLMEAGRWHFLT